MSWENSFLSWFADQGIPMVERSDSLGDLRYFQFSSAFDGVENKKMYSFGCSVDRKMAAVKCAAEAIERRFMDKFFHSSERHISASTVQLCFPIAEASPNPLVELPPFGMRTSNGWAIHANSQRAGSSACLEALERHLLIKSFYRWGWQGFRLVQEVKSDEMHLFFMTSRLTSVGYISGIVAAKSPHYPGVLFGYCVGKREKVQESAFWQPALLEATSSILSLDGGTIELENNANAWLRGNAKFYLENPFDLQLLRDGVGLQTEDDGEHTCFLKRFDLASSLGLSFPLDAAFCWGSSLIPLCNQSLLNEEGKKYFQAILEVNDLPASVPLRHPIL